MRGKGVSVQVQDAPYRITPAYAGKSFRRLSSLFSVRDHPRLCGEKLIKVQSLRKVLGSPPPMRGKGAGNLSDLDCFRITPAYAGKSSLIF